MQLDAAADLSGYGEVTEATPDGRRTVKVPKAQVSAVAARLLADHEVSDLTIEDPPIEDVIERVFADRPGDAGTKPAGPQPAGVPVVAP